MSPNPHEEEIYPVSLIILQEFLRENEFLVSEFRVASDYVIWEKNGILVKLPNKGNITETQVSDILSEAQLDKKDFEYFVRTVKPSGFFDKLIDMSLKTPPKRSKKPPQS